MTERRKDERRKDETPKMLFHTQRRLAKVNHDCDLSIDGICSEKARVMALNILFR